MDELDKKIDEKVANKLATETQNKEEKSLPSIPTPETKSLAEVNISDIEFKLDKTKSFEQQADDIVGAMAIAKAVSDEQTAQDIADKKAEELKAKASEKLKTAQAKETNAQSDLQEARRKKNEAVLDTFNIKTHLPDWLLKIMVFIFSPFYIALSIIIGIPCGTVKILIDNIDNILVRYEKAESQNKPKIKTTVWIVLIALLLGAIALIVLKCLNKI